MNRERTVEDYLRDIAEYAEKAMRFLADVPSVADLADDERTLLAVIRTLEVIGEAAKQIPNEFRARYGDVAWRGMTGMRDKVIHQYFGVNIEVVWRTVHEDFPPLREAILRILSGMTSIERDM